MFIQNSLHERFCNQLHSYVSITEQALFSPIFYVNGGLTMIAGYRRIASLLLAAAMLGSAVLHVYWVSGGTWFLSTALGMEVESLPADLIALTWIFIAFMLAASVLFLSRDEVISLPVPQKFLAVGCWFFTAVMFTGAVYNVMIPRFWDRWIFGPVFLVLAILSLILSLPIKNNRQ